MSRRNEVLDAAVEELKRLDIKYQIEISKRHVKLRWDNRLAVIPSSSSDYRGRANSRALVRRILREDGYTL